MSLPGNHVLPDAEHPLGDRRAQDPVRRAVGGEAAVVEEQQPVAAAGELPEIVGGHDDRDIPENPESEPGGGVGQVGGVCRVPHRTRTAVAHRRFQKWRKPFGW